MATPTQQPMVQGTAMYDEEFQHMRAIITVTTTTTQMSMRDVGTIVSPVRWELPVEPMIPRGEDYWIRRIQRQGRHT